VNPIFSTYLDLVRFLSALLVFLHHFAFPQLTGGRYESIGEFGEDAVMIFFVLSGYVIAYVQHREREVRTYVVNRLSRLYSVAIPALLLTLVADAIGRQADPAIYDGISTNHSILKTIVSVTFINQLWSADIRYFTNGPYWSISYEFWYYMFFACLAFTAGRIRVFLISAWVIIVGPPILLLLPVWLMGVAAFKTTQRRVLRLPVAFAMFVIPLPVYFLYRFTNVGDQLTAMTDVWVLAWTNDIYFLHKARFFLHDYIVGTLVAIQFVGAHSFFTHKQTNIPKIESFIRNASNHTFSLYLYHVPLLFCLAAWSPWAVGHAGHDAVLVLGTAIGVYALAPFTEARKETWREAIRGLLRLFDIFRHSDKRSDGSDSTPAMPVQSPTSPRSLLVAGAWLFGLFFASILWQVT
jgi:peptidoglycan/LPS O-acetylase OafA/YrhL